MPTWNYVAVHAHGPVEFFEDTERLREIVTRLTLRHEAARADPWAVTDAPERFIDAQLRGIVGLRLPITRLFGKRKMSQNRPEADRAGVAAGLGASEREVDRAVGALVDPETYDAWFRAKVQKSLDDPRPTVPHEQVVDEVQGLIDVRRRDHLDGS